MNKIFLVFVLLLLSGLVFAINPNVPYQSCSVMDSNCMGAMLVQEWSFGSIDMAFLFLSLATIVILLRYGFPISVMLIGVMGFATVFAFGFNSIIAWGILIAGIIALSLMIVIALLTKTWY